MEAGGHEALRGDMQLRTGRTFESGQLLNTDMERKLVTYGLNGNCALIHVKLIQEDSLESLPGIIFVMCDTRDCVLIIFNLIKGVALG